MLTAFATKTASLADYLAGRYKKPLTADVQDFINHISQCLIDNPCVGFDYGMIPAAVMQDGTIVCLSKHLNDGTLQEAGDVPITCQNLNSQPNVQSSQYVSVFGNASRDNRG